MHQQIPHFTGKEFRKKRGVIRSWRDETALICLCERNINENSHRFDAGKDHILLVAFQRDVRDRLKVEESMRAETAI